MKSLQSVIVLLLVQHIVFAQSKHFTTSGTIEYEKSINMYALIKKSITKENAGYLQSIYEQYKSTKPQFKTLKSVLAFNTNETIFKPVQEDNSNADILGNNPMTGQPNTVYTNFPLKVQIKEKNVYEQYYLLKDNTRKIRWKITDETRDIAGFHCRRANGILSDSIYVVAFYTIDIPISGGPESFNGLPGMILGIALPHENLTWFAVKVTDMPITDNIITAPTKGKAISYEDLMATLRSAMKDWGSFAKLAFKGLSF